MSINSTTSKVLKTKDKLAQTLKKKKLTTPDELGLEEQDELEKQAYKDALMDMVRKEVKAPSVPSYMNEDALGIGKADTSKLESLAQSDAVKDFLSQKKQQEETARRDAIEKAAAEKAMERLQIISGNPLEENGGVSALQKGVNGTGWRKIGNRAVWTTEGNSIPNPELYPTTEDATIAPNIKFGYASNGNGLNGYKDYIEQLFPESRNDDAAGSFFGPIGSAVSNWFGGILNPDSGIDEQQRNADFAARYLGETGEEMLRRNGIITDGMTDEQVQTILNEYATDPYKRSDLAAQGYFGNMYMPYNPEDYTADYSQDTGTEAYPMHGNLPDFETASGIDKTNDYITGILGLQDINQTRRAQTYDVPEGMEAADYQDRNRWSMTTDEERATFDGILKTYGPQAAQDWLGSMAEELDYRFAQAVQEQSGAKGESNPFLNTLGTVMTAPLRGEDYLGFLAKKAFGERTTDYDQSFTDTRQTESARAAALATIENPTLRSLAGDLISFGDNLANRLTFGVAGEWATLLSMASSAAGSAYTQAIDRGLSQTQAVATSVAAGVFEAMFEKISLDKVYNDSIPVDTFKNWAVDFLIKAGIEGSEEMCTELANMAFDYFANGGQSEYRKAVESYMKDGKSEEEAAALARKDMMQQILEAGFHGAIGGMFGGLEATVKNAGQIRADRAIHNFEKSTGLDMDSSEANKLFDPSIASYGQFAQAFQGLTDRAAAGMDYKQAAMGSETARQFLTEQARMTAFGIGNKKALQTESMKVKQFRQVSTESFSDNTTQDVRNQMSRSSKKQLNMQMGAIKAMSDTFGKKTGVKVVLEDSVSAKDANGKLRRANAYYDPKTNTVHLSATAQDGAFTYYLGHELTHAIRAKSNVDWQSLQQTVSDGLWKQGYDWNELVENQMQQYGYDQDIAEEEVIANTVPQVFKSRDVLTDILNQSPQVFRTVKQWASDAIKSLITTGKSLGQRNNWKQMGALDKETLQQINDVIMNVEKADSGENISENTTAPEELGNMSFEDEEDDDFEFANLGPKKPEFQPIDIKTREAMIDAYMAFGYTKSQAEAAANHRNRVDEKEFRYAEIKKAPLTEIESESVSDLEQMREGMKEVYGYDIMNISDKKSEALAKVAVNELGFKKENIPNLAKALKDAFSVYKTEGTEGVFKSVKAVIQEMIERTELKDEHHEALVEPLRDYFRGKTILLGEKAVQNMKYRGYSLTSFQRALGDRIKVTTDKNKGYGLDSYISEMEELGGVSVWLSQIDERDPVESLLTLCDIMKPKYLSAEDIGTDVGEYASETAKGLIDKYLSEVIGSEAYEVSESIKGVAGENLQDVFRKLESESAETRKVALRWIRKAAKGEFGNEMAQAVVEMYDQFKKSFEEKSEIEKNELLMNQSKRLGAEAEIEKEQAVKQQQREDQAEADEDIRYLRKEVGWRDKQIEGLRSDIRNAQKTIDSLEAKIQSVKQRGEVSKERALEKQITAAKEQKQKLIDNLKSLRTENKELYSEWAKTDRELMRAKKQLGETQTALTGEKAKAKSKLDALREKLKASQETSRQKTESLREATRIAKHKLDWAVAFKNKEISDARTRTHQESIAESVKKLTTVLEAPTDKSHVPQSLQEPLAKVVGSLNFDGRNNVDTRKIADNLKSFASAFSNDMRIQAVQSEDGKEVIELGGIYNSELEQLRNDILECAENIQQNSLGNVYSMNEEDTKAIAGILRRVQTVVTKAGKLRGSRISGYDDVEQAAMAQRVELEHKKQYMRKNPVTRAMSKYLTDLYDPKTFFHKLGTVAGELFDNLRDGQDTQTKHVQQTIDYVEKYGKFFKIDYQECRNTRINAMDDSGKEISMTKAQLMALYVLNNRDQGRKHIYGKGILIRGNNDFVPSQFTEDEIKTLCEDNLTRKERDFALMLQDYLSTTVGNWGNRYTMEMFGYKKFNEQFYWPIQTDSASRSGNSKTDLAPQSSFDQNALAHTGSSKALNKNANNAIWINDIFDDFASHVQEMSMYDAYGIPMYDLTRVLTNAGGGNGVKTWLKQIYGSEASSYLNRFIESVNKIGERPQNSRLASIGKGLTRIYKSQAIGGNLSVTVQQPTSITRAFSMMNPLDVYLGSKEAAKLIVNENERKLMYKYCPTSLWKHYGFFDTGIGPSLSEMLFGGKTKAGDLYNKVNDISMKPAQVADDLTMMRLWAACKRETARLYPSLTGEAFYKQAGKRMTDIVDRTQVVDSVFTKSAVLNMNGDLTKMMTSFMSEPLKSYNMIARSINEVYNAEKGSLERRIARINLHKSVASWVVSGAVSAAAKSLVMAARHLKRDKDYGEQFGEEFGSEFLGNLNPLEMIPGVKQVYETVTSYFQGGGMFSSSGTKYDESTIKGIMSSITSMKNNFESEEEVPFGKWALDSAKVVSYLTGVPVYNVARDLMSAAYIVTGEDLTGTRDATNSEAGATMAQHALSGNIERINEVRNTMITKEHKSPDEVDKAFATAMAKKDPDEFFTKLAVSIEGYRTTEAEKAVQEAISKWGMTEDQVMYAAASRWTSIKKEFTSAANRYYEAELNGNESGMDMAIAIAHQKGEKYGLTAKQSEAILYDKAGTLSDTHSPDNVLEKGYGYSYSDAVKCVKVLVGMEDGNLSTDDLDGVIRAMMEESSAKDPAKTIASNMKKHLTEIYEEQEAAGNHGYANRIMHIMERYGWVDDRTKKKKK